MPAAAARAGWDSVVLIPSSLEQAKILTTAVYDGTLLAVVHSEHGDSRHPAVRVVRTGDGGTVVEH